MLLLSGPSWNEPAELLWRIVTIMVEKRIFLYNYFVFGNDKLLCLSSYVFGLKRPVDNYCCSFFSLSVKLMLSADYGRCVTEMIALSESHARK